MHRSQGGACVCVGGDRAKQVLGGLCEKATTLEMSGSIDGPGERLIALKGA